jgi:hypothetical protein
MARLGEHSAIAQVFLNITPLLTRVSMTGV